MRLPRDEPIAAGRPPIELAPDVVAAILRTVENGWTLALRSPDVGAAAGEVVMTERLRDGMRAALDSGGLPWGRTLIVLPGAESWCCIMHSFRLHDDELNARCPGRSG